MEIEKQRNRLGGAARSLSILGGGAALWYGLRRKSLFGSAVAVAGANYVVRGITGSGDLLAYLDLGGARSGLSYGRGIKIRRSVTINNKTREELYGFWRNFENLPHFMKHIESVRVIDETHSHWVLKGLAGGTVEWDAEVVANRENELIGWRSVAGMVNHAGSVRFEDAPGGRGTVVRVQLQYNPPGGRVADTLAKLLGQSAEQQISDDMRRFKQLMEAGEIITTDGQPSGRRDAARTRGFAERPGHETMRSVEPVETASEESFPASDAPAWAGGGN